MKSSTSILGLATMAGVVLALSGCTFSANLTVPADDVASLAADAVGAQWGTDAEIDCGDESVDLVEGNELDCVAHNPNSGLDYPATVTITDVDGLKYSIDVSVGQASGPEEEPSTEEPSTDVPADAPTVTPESLAELAASALEPELGYKPVIDCGPDRVAIYVDAQIDCVATGDDGIDYPAYITVTDVSSSNYNIDVSMGAEPIS